MKILLHNEIDADLKLCRKKKWYNGLDDELPRLYRLLKTDKRLPGQSPIHHLGPEWGGKVFHARIALPKESCGGRNGGRIIYVFLEEDCFVLYTGGHRDKRYDDSRILAALILERLEIRVYREWEE